MVQACILLVGMHNPGITMPSAQVKEFDTSSVLSEPHREKTGLLPMRKQRRRSASR